MDGSKSQGRLEGLEPCNHYNLQVNGCWMMMNSFWWMFLPAMSVTYMQVDAVYRSGAKASTNHQFKTLCTEDEPEPDATTEIIETTTTTVIEDPLAMCDASQKLELKDFVVDMKVKSYGQEPEETEGLALVSWTHSMDCISTYGLHLCQTGEESCWEGSLEAGPLGATLKQDLSALLLPNRLQQCSDYTLTILPSDKVTNKILALFQHISTFPSFR